MQKYINKALFLIALVLIVVFFFVLPKKNENKYQTYESNLFYMDTYISVQLFLNDEEKANQALEEVNNIYKTYHELSDTYGSYPSNNVYYINHNQDNISKITIDSKLYELLKYGVDWYEKSNHLLNINMGSITSIWKKYREKENGVPTKEELSNHKTSIKNIVLLDENQIENTHPNIDLGALAKGYATEEVVKYLKAQGIDQYLINAGGNVAVGKYYKKGKYKIGVEDPTDTTAVYTVIKGENISVVTSGGYQRYYEYEGKKYHHIIDPNTLYPAENMKSVTVVANDGALADALSTTLFLMSVEEGQKYLENFDAEAIWYQNDGKIVKSKGFSKYE